jgi:hypothetical protein
MQSLVDLKVLQYQGQAMGSALANPALDDLLLKIGSHY